MVTTHKYYPPEVTSLKIRRKFLHIGIKFHVFCYRGHHNMQINEYIYTYLETRMHVKKNHVPCGTICHRMQILGVVESHDAKSVMSVLWVAGFITFHEKSETKNSQKITPGRKFFYLLFLSPMRCKNYFNTKY